MWFEKRFVKFLSLLMSLAILSSCTQYSPIKVPKSPPPEIKGRVLKIIWANSISSDTYLLYPEVHLNRISGTAHSFPYFKLKNNKDVIEIFVTSPTAPPDSFPSQYSIPFSHIVKIIKYEEDPIGGLFKTVATIAGIGVAAYCATLLILLLLKESCPFIYCWNGTSNDFVGEIYSGAIFPNLERDDYLPLPSIQAKDRKYEISMTNEVREIQHTNLTELLLIDHPKGTAVLVDQKGIYQTYRQPVSPVTAYTKDGKDVLPLLIAKDDLKYSGDSTAVESQSNDTIYLNFRNPEKARNGKLVIRAKNSYWLDLTLGQFFNMFGEKYDSWYNQHRNSSQQEQKDWSLKQGIPLSVYMKQQGEWKFVDYFNVIGPMAEKDIIMPMTLPKTDNNMIELKLENGAFFWEVNYAGMDFTDNEAVRQRIIPLCNAKDQDGKDVLSLLNKSDGKYFTMAEIGNKAYLQFDAPDMDPGYSRSVFLHSRGHYKVLRSPTGKPDVARLKSFLEPGKLGSFSRHNFIELSKSCSDMRCMVGE